MLASAPMSTTTPAPGPATDPAAMRTAMAAFVATLHRAYLDQARLLPPGERARLPLLTARPLQVVAVGNRYLHVLATTDPLPAPQGQEVELADDLDGLHWTVRFFDPVVLPELGLVDESAGARPADVRRVLGVADVVYHLSVAPGGGLSGHHAQHAGTGLANSHAAAARDHEALRDAARGREELVDEFAVAERVGLPHAARLLAAAIAPASDEVARASADPAVDPTALRGVLLAALRPATREHP